MKKISRAVVGSMDQVKVVTRAPYLFEVEFDSEAEANAFIVARAERYAKEAEADMGAARERLKRVQKKFGPTPGETKP